MCRMTQVYKDNIALAMQNIKGVKYIIIQCV